MNLPNTDPRLTAYALGELEGDELHAFEAELLHDELAQAQVVQVKDTAARLRHAFAEDPAPALSEAQRARLRAAFRARRGAAGGDVAAGRGAVTGVAAVPRSPDGERARPAVRRRVPRWSYLLAALVPAAAALFLSQREGAQMPPTGNGSEELALVPDGDMSTALRIAPGTGSGPGALGSAPMAGVSNDSAFSLSMPTTPPNGQSNAPRSLLPELHGRDSYSTFDDGDFTPVSTTRLSTFSIDVDTASYSIVRRLLTAGLLPPRDAVRIEELVNYFAYDYGKPSAGEPLAVTGSVAAAPWNPENRLVRIALTARELPERARPVANLVLLLDVSGSMQSADKLPLVQYGVEQLVASLDERDRVSIVVYAGASGVVLPPTPGDRKDVILGAVARLEAGGGTNGADGIELAYQLAAQNFRSDGINRVILATDGDFNVGVTEPERLLQLIEKQAKNGTFLSVLGVGHGDYQDATLELLADRGNGNYAYLDDRGEARRVLVEQAAGTLATVARDVKLQVQFSPLQVQEFRLLGYENRALADGDFANDAKDAGDIGAGQRVTALYEVVPRAHARSANEPPMLSVTLRYQPPLGGESQVREIAIADEPRALAADFAFAAAVAEFSMLLRGSPRRGDASFDQVLSLAGPSLGLGPERVARERFLELARTARRLTAERNVAPASPFDDPSRVLPVPEPVPMPSRPPHGKPL